MPDTHCPSSPSALVSAAAPKAPDWDDALDEGDADAFKPLTREEARQWRQRHPAHSVWRVVQWQLLLCGLAVVSSAVLVWCCWAGRWSIVWSVAYGGLCVLLPSAVMAYGMTSGALARRWKALAGARGALAAWMVWEGVKVLLTLALLGLAPRWIPDLNWLGLLAGLVVVLKSYGLAWWARPAARR